MISQVVFQNPKVLHKYVAMYAANLIKENKILEAMDLYVKYGSPAAQQVCIQPANIKKNTIMT